MTARARPGEGLSMRGSGFPTPRWLPWLRPLTSDAPGALAPPSCHLVEPRSCTNTEAVTPAVSCLPSLPLHYPGQAPIIFLPDDGNSLLLVSAGTPIPVIRSAPTARSAFSNTNQIVALELPTSPRVLGAQQAPAQTSPLSWPGHGQLGAPQTTQT